jgi:hypothetical protein
MKDHRISSFEDLHRAIERRYMGKVSIFRGVTDVEEHTLVSSVGRLDGYTRELEDSLLQLFKRHTPPFLVGYMPEDDWEWLALAQHHGLPTRLLDWTYSPLVAAYFAVEQESEADSAIYVSEAPEIVDTSVEEDPFEVDEVCRYQPDHFTPRINAQSGIFTFHPEPAEAFKERTLERIIIPNELRGDFKQILAVYGVHRGTLFPDLDGQARYIKWRLTDDY